MQSKLARGWKKERDRNEEAALGIDVRYVLGPNGKVR
jgi:hypothetical protein